ncbi:MAG: flagellin [Bdellovibrionales bacterium RIFOXYD12_FULL_39_22]|nr:MAG: flagellin [Bdellovibrionales bacterium RIFOXYB1_FULL_39_21]OFZ44710.1 MAG: flagellin [Bdellovibrionales bacterium RIFOXYC12_FULL_39_17]OFZ49340.1 MAG: flagellin [Bdellovibrionales bacterium RIFOXYC1_FULL_39_130]OFZ77076.1 MAG: flagellin [Bdellovibrionales bacterium RIFOXYD1_FULL_39_84]OFZ95336.1 MAG: flagellin [Bdellovibrionales bacterium RIFOXYD12_FULL_39_22]HLE13047.1 flagellin [Bacteriovoracaceae bacterium]
MGLRINTNVASLNAQRNLGKTRLAMDQTLEKLSSGQRINRAGDDAAGLAISENLKAQIRGLDQAERNAQDGISLVQIAEGALSEVSNILIRLRELSVQAASDTIGSTERKFLNVEFEQLTSEIDRIANSTEFNRVPLLDGTGAVFDIQIGTRNDPITDRLTFDASSADVNVAALGLNLASVADKISSQNSLSAIDQAIISVSGIRADFGALQNRLQSTINNINVSKENLASANSRVRDADIAKETADLTKNNILVQAGTSVLAQANAYSKNALQLIGSASQV